MKIPLDDETKEVLALFAKHHLRALIVGGYVRDAVMKQELGTSLSSKDVDIEVYGAEFKQIIEVMKELLKPINLVGKQFGVIKYGNLDISLPRKDSKTGISHKEFDVTIDSKMSVEQAARRRDLTINALAYDPITEQIIDCYGGVSDVRNRILRHTDTELFPDDPLRVLRIMQFAGRFNFSVDNETVKLCKRLDLSSISTERIGEEWRKLLTKSVKPSVGLLIARQIGIIEKLHPELHNLIGCEQENDWHPEGDVWVHSLMASDIASEIATRENLQDDERYTIVLAALCHDMGKAVTTAKDETGRIRSHGHAEAGVQIAKSFLQSIDVPKSIIDQVLPLVRYHMFIHTSGDAKVGTIRRLARKLNPATLQQLLWLVEADKRGRGTQYDNTQLFEFQKLIENAQVLHEPIEPIIKGRHIMDITSVRGSALGGILNTLYEAQMDGVFDDLESGLKYAKETNLL